MDYQSNYVHLFPEVDLAGYTLMRRGHLYYICDFIKLEIKPILSDNFESFVNKLTIAEVDYIFDNSNQSSEAHNETAIELKMWVIAYVHGDLEYCNKAINYNDVIKN